MAVAWNSVSMQLSQRQASYISRKVAAGRLERKRTPVSVSFCTSKA